MRNFLKNSFLRFTESKNLIVVTRLQKLVFLGFHLRQTNLTENFLMFPKEIEKMNGFQLRVGVNRDWPDDYQDNYGLPASKNINIYLLQSYTFLKNI